MIYVEYLDKGEEKSLNGEEIEFLDAEEVHILSNGKTHVIKRSSILKFENRIKIG